MIHPDEDDTAAVRSVFIIDPNMSDLTMTYPMAVGHQFAEILRVIDALQTTNGQKLTPADYKSANRLLFVLTFLTMMRNRFAFQDHYTYG